MPSKKYPLPPFLNGRCTEEAYVRWLSRKATAHVKRDRKRGNAEARRSPYMVAIHAAVVAGEGADFYTGEPLDWERISKYSNEESKARRRAYKRELAMLPTVDHVGDGLGPADFQICSWRTNDCKADLSHSELIEFSRLVIAHCESLASLASSDCSNEVTDAINRVCDQVGDQRDEFVAAAARRVLEKTEW